MNYLKSVICSFFITRSKFLPTPTSRSLTAGSIAPSTKRDRWIPRSSRGTREAGFIQQTVTWNLLLFLLLLFSSLYFFLTTTMGLYTLAKLANMALPGHLSIQHIEGSLIKGISFKQLTYSDPTLDVNVLGGNIEGKLTQKPLHLTLLVNHLHVKKLHISREKTVAKQETQHHHFAIPSIPFDIQINPLIIDELSIAQTKVEHLQLFASINNANWTIKKLKATYENHHLDLQGQGQLQKPYRLVAALQMKVVPGSQGVTGQMAVKGSQTAYSWDGQLTGAVPVMLSGTLKHLVELDSTLSIGVNQLTLSGHLPDQLHLNLYIPQPQSLHPALANIKTTIKGSGAMKGTQQGDFTMDISPGLLESSQNSSIPSIPFQGGRLSISLTPKALNATVDMMLNPNETIKGSLRLPGFSWKQATSASQSVDGSLSLRVNSLVFLNELVSGINDLHGQLSADLILKGSLGAPDIRGTLKLVDAGFSLPEAGIVLNPIQATLTSQNKHWDVVGAVGAGDGHVLNVKGSGELLPNMMGSIMINADRFPVLNLPEYTINISPQLLIKLDQDEVVDISGVVDIPAARLKPMTFSNTESLTDDAVFVSHESVKTSPIIPVNVNVLVKIGQDVVIDAQGLHGVLGGQIQMTQPVGGSLQAIGALTIRDGRYKAYGQDLAINSGQLIFSGATPDNPQIILRAVRTFNNTSQFSGSNQLFDFNASNLQTIDFGNHVTVGIDVGGYLNAPKVKLFSIPSSLSQADILSLLLLGKPASQASQSGGQLLMTAVSAMNLDSGSKGMQLLTQLQQTFGLDFDVQNNATSNQGSSVGDTAFVVGKALSKRLYLSYSVGILQENSNVLILKYLLNKFFSVQVTASSTENGVDFLYSA